MVTKRKNKLSVQKLIGIKEFGRNGIVMQNNDEMVFFEIAPTNISVLTAESVEVKIRSLQQLLTLLPEIEICCLDAKQNFDSNKHYLSIRIEEERDVRVKGLLQAERKHLESIQMQMSTSRQFLIIYHIKNLNEEQAFANLNRLEKTIADNGFDVKRLNKEELKRFLAIYFNCDISNLQEFDGEKTAERWVIE